MTFVPYQLDERDSRRRAWHVLWFLLLSLFFHFVFFIVLPQPASQPDPEELQALDVTLVKKPHKLADIMPPKQEVRPKKADFIGMYDSTVKEEQVARTPPNPGTAQKAAKPQELPKPEQRQQEQESLASVYAMKKEQAKKREAAASPSSRIGELPEDFFPDYKVGNHTYLNVLRFPNVQYFVRLKRIFKTTFNPVPVLRNYVMTNQVSRGTVEVVLGVVVDGNGRLAKLFIINSSGLQGYDQEAVRTVRDSSPFAKVPDNLKGEDGLLRMSWTFTVYL